MKILNSRTYVGATGRSPTGRSPLPNGVRIVQRQMHQKSGASSVANRALDLNFASEMLDVPPHNRQSEPGSPLPGGEEWSKHLVLHCRINSRTIVFYDNQSEPLRIDLQNLLARL